MPNSLKSRLKKLKSQGLLSEKDLNRIIVISDKATNGDVIKFLFDCKLEDEFSTSYLFEIENNGYCTLFDKKWWNAPYKLSELKEENNDK